MASASIGTATAGGIMTVKINRPEKMNALTPEMHAALQDAFDRFAADPAIIGRILQIDGTAREAYREAKLRIFERAGVAVVPRDSGIPGIEFAGSDHLKRLLAESVAVRFTPEEQKLAVEAEKLDDEGFLLFQQGMT